MSETDTVVVYPGKPLEPGVPVITVARIVEALCTISDPEIPVNICDLGLVHDICIASDSTVSLKMTLTSPACVAADALLSNVARTLAALPGVRKVSVCLALDPPWTSDCMSDVAKLIMGVD